MMSTYFAKPGEINQEWYVFDAKDQILGRLATQIADVLRGKHKPQYTPHVDVGDFVIVINADKVKLTGKKLLDKEYIHHSQYPGGLKRIAYDKLLKTKPEKAVSLAVKRMIPSTKLGKRQFLKLKVYSGSDHPHIAQNPKVWQVEN